MLGVRGSQARSCRKTATFRTSEAAWVAVGTVTRHGAIPRESGWVYVSYAVIVFGGEPPVCSPGSLGKGVSNSGGFFHGRGGVDVRALIAPGVFTGG